jgi:septal ring factor EnvC (AmiA/AmiB activator)
LVDAAVANRAEIEIQLTATLTRISDLAAQLSTVAADLDKVEEQIVFADAEMTSIESEIEVQAVDAYMNALAIPMLSFVNSDTIESALVAGVVVEEVVISGRQAVEQLIAKKNELETLQADYLTKQDEVADLKAEVDLEVE